MMKMRRDAVNNSKENDQANEMARIYFESQIKDFNLRKILRPNAKGM